MTITEINQAIMRGQFNNDELSSIVDAVKYARARLGHKVMHQLSRGDAVQFVGRQGLTVTGTVVEFKLKNVIVQAGSNRWRVPANMLTKV